MIRVLSSDYDEPPLATVRVNGCLTWLQYERLGCKCLNDQLWQSHEHLVGFSRTFSIRHFAVDLIPQQCRDGPGRNECSPENATESDQCQFTAVCSCRGDLWRAEVILKSSVERFYVKQQIEVREWTDLSEAVEMVRRILTDHPESRAEDRLTLIH